MSIPLVILGSTMLMKIMERFPIIIALGAALLGYLAGRMLATDSALQAWLEARLPAPDLMFGAGGAILVVAIGQWLRLRRPRREPA
jgi:predicted tellurium resistance membrane protein TerC